MVWILQYYNLIAIQIHLVFSLNQVLVMKCPIAVEHIHARYEKTILQVLPLLD